MNFRRKPFVGLGLAALGASLSSCATHPARFETSSSKPEKPRRPPAVFVDRSFALPEPDTRKSGDALVVLVPPVDSESAKQLVSDFFRALTSEDTGRLEALFAEGAMQQTPRGTESRAAQSYWERRLARLDYAVLSAQPLYRPSDVRVVRAGDLEHLPESERPPFSLESRELALSVPLVTTRAGKERVFGDELSFLIREESGELRIARIAEDFRLP